MNDITVIEIPKEKALQVFTTKNGLDPYLQQIAEQVKSLVPDTSSRKGREEIASVAYKVAKTKTALDKAGKGSVEDLKAKTKLVDAERKRMREFLDSLKDEVRAPLTEWEQAEDDRKQRHAANVDLIVKYRDVSEESSADDVAQLIYALEQTVIDELYEEYEAEAHREKALSLKALKVSLERRKAYEAEHAELARLRAEAAERERKDYEERIAREAVERAQREALEREAKAKADSEAKAKAEREAAEARELELRRANEKAERERLEAIEQQKQAEERAKQAAIETEKRLKREAEQKAAAEAAEAAKREANRKHKAKIHNEALAEFVSAGFSKDQAKEIVSLIAAKKVPHISITY